MPDLEFQVERVEVVPYSVVPQLAFAIAVRNRIADESIHAAVLRCQIQLDVTLRKYMPEEEVRLRDLFGEPSRWGTTLRTMLWTHTSVVLSPFTQETVVSLPVPCTYDFTVASTKYFSGLASGEVPLSFLFSGTIFYANAEGTLQVAPISLDKEARFRLPVQTWHELMQVYYPNEAWLHLRQDVFDRLYRYKVERGIPTWEQALESVLPPSQNGVTP
jgi:Family of unknown function (DUF6084)